MPLVADRVRESTTTTGTGTITLAGAPSSFRTFAAAFGTGVSVYYVIAGPSEWEVGIGTTGAGTLSRDAVLASSNNNALVDFSAGGKDVFCAYTATRAVTTSDAATLTNKTIDDLSNFVGANQLHIKAKATENLVKGDVVKVTGWNAGENAAEVAKVSSATDVAFGMADTAINIGDLGAIVNTGFVEGINTNSFTIGTILYPNTSGGLTSTKPASGQYQAVAFVLRQSTNNGTVYVEFTNPQPVEASTNTANTIVLRDGSGNFAANSATLAGNLTFNSTGQRIVADMSNATVSNRFAFQNSTANAQSIVGVLPNGTGTTSQVQLFNNSDPTNGAFAGLFVSAAEARLQSGIQGSGTYLPLTFYTNGAERVRIDTSGNFGLGFTPVASDLRMLQINAASTITCATNEINISQNASYAVSAWRYIGATTATRYQQAAGTHTWFTAPSGNAGDSIAAFGTPAMTLSASGNLIVGGTTDGGARLTVFGGSLPTSSGLHSLYNNGTSSGRLVSSIQSLGVINTYLDDSTLELSAGTTNTVTSGIVLTGGGAGATNPNLVRFYTASAERARIDASGNFSVDTNTLYVNAANNRVGVGTTSPLTALDVRGVIASSFSGFVYSTIDGVTDGNLYVTANAGAANTTASNIIFRGSTSGSAVAERMRLDASGNLGLGVTPSANASIYYRSLELGKPGCGLFAATPSLTAGELTYLAGNAVLTYSGGPAWVYGNNGPAGVYGIEDGNHKWFVAPSGTNAGDSITFAQALTLDSSGVLNVRGAVGTGWAPAYDGISLSRDDRNTYVTTYYDDTSIVLGAGVSQKTGVFVYGQSHVQGNMIAFRTGNADRMRITGLGNVLINSTSHVTTFPVGYTGWTQIAQAGNAQLALMGYYDAPNYGGEVILSKSRSNTIGTNIVVQSGDNIGTVWFSGANGTTYLWGASIRAVASGTINATSMPSALLFATTPAASSSPVDRLRINPDGNVGVGTTPNSWFANWRAIQGTGDGGSFAVASSGNGMYVLSNAYLDSAGQMRYTTPGNATYYQQVSGAHYWYTAAAGANANDAITFGSAKMTLFENGNLTLGGTGNSGKVRLEGATNEQTSLQLFRAGVTCASIWNSGPLCFGVDGSTGYTEKMRLDSSGRLFVGTVGSTHNIRLEQKLAVVAAGNNNYTGVALTGYTGANGPAAPVLDFNKSRGATDETMTLLASGDRLGVIVFRGADGSAFRDAALIQGVVDGTPGASDMPGRIEFHTTPDGQINAIERVRITSRGYMKASNDGTHVDSASFYHELRTSTNQNEIVQISHTSNTEPFGQRIKYTAASPNGTGSWFLYCDDSTALRAEIRSNGGIANYSANNVALSDARLKIDITPVATYWSKIKAIEVVTFKYTDQTHDDTNVGLIAQQVETVAPEFVDIDGFGITPDDGVPLKAIYNTDLQFAALRALQEAMARIETLEQRVAALEA